MSIPISTDGLDQEAQKAINQNVLNGNGSDGFDFGVYFGTWVAMNNAVHNWVPTDIESLSPGYKAIGEKNNEIQEKNNRELPLKYYNKFREFQAQWGIDDKTLCEINNIDYDSEKPYFDEWYAKAHQNDN